MYQLSIVSDSFKNLCNTIILVTVALLSGSQQIGAQPSEPDEKSETDPSCGVTEQLRIYQQKYPAEYKQRLAIYANRTEENRRALGKKSIQGVCPDGITVIPIAFHLFHEAGAGIGTGYNFSLADLQKTVSQLNADFAGLNLNKNKIINEFQLVDPGHSCVQFTIAKINRIDRSTCSFWSEGATFYDLHLCLPGGSGIGSANDPTEYLNVYSNEINNGLLGQASCIPPVFGQCNTDYDGVTMNANILIPYHSNSDYQLNAEGSVLAHEIGHWLGLPHVDGDIAGAGYTGDDGFNDTNSQAFKTRYECSGPVTNTCGTTDNVFNYMDYARDCATSMFTAEQKQAMIATLNNERLGISSSYANGTYDLSLYDVSCISGLADASLNDVIDIQCYGSVNLLNYMQAWYPAVYEQMNVANGLQTFTWSKKGVNGSYFNSYIDIGGAEFIHKKSSLTDTITLTLTFNCWDPVNDVYTSGVKAGELKVVTHNCAATINDLCSQAIQVDAQPYCISQEFPYYEVDAEGSDLSCGVSGTDRDLWFQTVVPVTGQLTITTVDVIGGLTDMTMEIFSGTCNNLSLVSCNDDFAGSLQSSITLTSQTPGDILFIRVADSEGDDDGIFGLCVVEEIGNDDCIDAISVTVGQNCSYTEYALLNATPSGMPLNTVCGSIGVGNDIWFSFVAPASGHVVVETTDSDNVPMYDLMMELYRGSCGSLSQIACNDDSEVNGRFNYIALSDLTPGELIFIRINSYASNSEGKFNLCVYDELSTACSLNYMELGIQSSCNGPTNTYSQEVIIHYNSNGTANFLDINNQQFDLISNPQLIMVNDIPANGSNISLSGRIYNCNSGNSNGRTLRFTGPTNCYTGSVLNDDCVDAISLVVNSTCIEDLYDNTGAAFNSNSGSFCNFAGNNPQDVWFKFVVPASGEVIVNGWRPDRVSPVFEIYEDCTGTNKVAECGAYRSSIRLSGRIPGEELYIQVADQSGDHQGQFGICIIDPEPHDNDVCSTARELIVGSDCNPLVFSNHVAIAEMGSISCDGSGNASVDIWFSLEMPAAGNVSIVIEDAEYGFNSFVTEVYTGTCSNLNLYSCESVNSESINVTGLSSSQIIFVRVADYGSFRSQALSICATVKENDICAGAIDISAGSCMVVDNIGSTASDNPYPGLACGYNGVGNDVWFSTIVPASGQLTIETNRIVDQLTSVNLEVYRGSDCNNLNTLACSRAKDQWNNYAPFGKVELEGQTPGDVIYIRVIERFSNQEGQFELCVSDAGYDYSCRIQLIELGAQGQCDPVTNTFDQELIITYHSDGTATEIQILDEFFTLSTSPQSITLTGLPASGGPIEISALLSNGGQYDECSSLSEYYSPDLLIAAVGCYAGTVQNDDCASAIPLPVSQGCIDNTFDNTGAAPNPQLGNTCNAGQYALDVWFSVVVPASGELIINTWGLGSMSPGFDIYEGSCGALSEFLFCGYNVRSLRLRDRQPFETIYIRAYGIGNNQGQFGICAIEPEALTNDVCADAIEIPVLSECSSAVYSDHYAAAELGQMTCDNSNSNNDSEDMWFKVIVPMSGELSIYTEEVERGFSDMVMEVYNGACQTAFPPLCESNGGQNGHPQVDLANVAPGTELFIRIASYGFNSKSSFRICAIADCPDYDIVSAPKSGMHDYEAAVSVTGDDLIENTARVDFDAGVYVDLLPGFEVERGAVFHAFIDGCGGI